MFRKIVILLFCIIPFMGCISTTSQTSVDDLKKELSLLQIKTANLEAKQVDVYSKYEENLVNVDTTKASIDELYNKVSELSRKMKEMETFVKKQEDGKEVAKLPSNVYENAYNDFLLRKYSIATEEFKSFLNGYKNHDLADQAQYYIGESLYLQNKYADAYEEYKKIEQNYKDSSLIPSSRLKMALCLELLNKKTEAIVIFQSILKDYPKTGEAFTAKEKIRLYTNEKSK